MAELTGSGCLLSSHILWLLNRANEAQDTSLCLCLGTTNPDQVRRLAEGRGNLQHLVFVINVGKDPDNSVYISSLTKPCAHWVLVTVDLGPEPLVKYCDSLAWGIPHNLLGTLSPFTEIVGHSLRNAVIVNMHVTTQLGSSHECSAECRNYPLQSCSNVCGVVTVICGTVAALDRQLFQELTGPRSKLKMFLHDPTRYQHYLRRVLIRWFMDGALDMNYVKTTHTSLSHTANSWNFTSHPTPSSHTHDHACIAGSTQGQKRKPESASHTKTKHARQSKTDQTHFSNTSSQKPAEQESHSTTGRQAHPKKSHQDTQSSRSSGHTSKNESHYTTESQAQPKINHQDTNTQPSRSSGHSSHMNSQAHCNTTNSQADSDTTQAESTATNQNKTHFKATTEQAAAPNTQEHFDSNTSQSDFNTEFRQANPNTSHTQESSTAKIDMTKGEKTCLASRHTCQFCSETFKFPQSLNKHKKSKHPNESQHTIKDYNHCCCELCHFKCCRIQDLIQHYNTGHHQGISMHTQKFTSEEQFLEWKKQTEKDTSTQFYKPCGPTTQKNIKCERYYCHRSGIHKPVEIRKRVRKGLGSHKTGKKCTAYMIVHRNIVNGSVIVEYCLQHTGHNFKLGHQKMSDDLRSLIAGKLAQGVEPDKILDDIRDKITEVDRDTSVTKKDIYNIKHQYNISRTEKHKQDWPSVALWVEELKQEVDNPIIFFKAQDTQHKDLAKSDCLLCIQTAFQRNMMRKHASKMIFIDSTHGTTQYDFSLTTILVLDKFHEAVPVAWAISNKEDALILKNFMQAIKEACGQDIHTNIFMSDLENNFYNAWCSVFTKPSKRLYCTWHVDRAWRRNIKEMMVRNSQQDQCNTYAYLKMLESETDEACFRKQLQEFLAHTQLISPSFQKYFASEYVSNNKIELWAACFRIGALSNTNMFAEAFHRVLKDIYFNKKQNKRVDNLLIVLLKIARDKAVEQLIKLKKGNVTHRLQDIRDRHKKATNIFGVQKTAEDEWTVPSSSDVVYCIKKVRTEHCQCKLVCDLCSVCIHMYTCTCTDFLTKTITCKHIHAVHMTDNKSNQRHTVFTTENINQSSSMHNVEDEDNVDIFKVVQCKNKPKLSSDAGKLFSAGMSSIDNIIQLLLNSRNNDDICTMQTVVQRLQDAFEIGSGMRHISLGKDFEKKKTFPSNKHFELQKRFSSTKRKRRKESKLSLKKPDMLHKEKLKGDLSQIPP